MECRYIGSNRSWPELVGIDSILHADWWIRDQEDDLTFECWDREWEVGMEEEALEETA